MLHECLKSLLFYDLDNLVEEAKQKALGHVRYLAEKKQAFLSPRLHPAASDQHKKTRYTMRESSAP